MKRMLRVAPISVPLACAAALLVIAVQVLAAGPVCTTVLHMTTGAVICSEAACTGQGQSGTCKVVGSWDPLDDDGWHSNPQPVTLWSWGPQGWVLLGTTGAGGEEIQDCECTGPDDEDGHYTWIDTNLCCNLVKVKYPNGSGFVAGTMGLCNGPCPAAHPSCKPKMGAGGFLAEAECQD